MPRRKSRKSPKRSRKSPKRSRRSRKSPKKSRKSRKSPGHPCRRGKRYKSPDAECDTRYKTQCKSRSPACQWTVRGCRKRPVRSPRSTSDEMEGQEGM